jgi:septum formation protein
VLGGVALVLAGEGDPEPRSAVEASTVRFQDLGEPLIDAYVASGEWHGRAGGYAIQGLGSALVDEVRGDLANVIGLPVSLLFSLAPELFAAP